MTQSQLDTLFKEDDTNLSVCRALPKAHSSMSGLSYGAEHGWSLETGDLGFIPAPLVKSCLT